MLKGLDAELEQKPYLKIQNNKLTENSKHAKTQNAGTMTNIYCKLKIFQKCLKCI